MYKLPFLPNRDGYTVSFGNGSVLSQSLRGGVSRQRSDLPKSSRIVPVSFTLDEEQYNIMMGFYRDWEDQPRLFLADLIIDTSILEEYQCTFVADSVSLTSQSGLTYVVAAQLEVLRKSSYIGGQDYYRALMMLEQEYGSLKNAKSWILNPMKEIVNEILPRENP